MARYRTVTCDHCAVSVVNNVVVHEAGCPTLGNPNDSSSPAGKAKKALDDFYASDAWKNRKP